MTALFIGAVFASGVVTLWLVIEVEEWLWNRRRDRHLRRIYRESVREAHEARRRRREGGAW